MARLESGGLMFEWGDAKARANLRKHGVDFLDAPAMFTGRLLTAADLRQDYGEERWVGIGDTAGRTLVIAFSQPAAATIRVISLRKATKSERRAYEKAVQDELGQD